MNSGLGKKVLVVIVALGSIQMAVAENSGQVPPGPDHAAAPATGTGAATPGHHQLTKEEEDCQKLGVSTRGATQRLLFELAVLQQTSPELVTQVETKLAELGKGPSYSWLKSSGGGTFLMGFLVSAMSVGPGPGMALDPVAAGLGQGSMALGLVSIGSAVSWERSGVAQNDAKIVHALTEEISAGFHPQTETIGGLLGWDARRKDAFQSAVTDHLISLLQVEREKKQKDPTGQYKPKFPEQLNLFEIMRKKSLANPLEIQALERLAATAKRLSEQGTDGKSLAPQTITQVDKTVGNIRAGLTAALQSETDPVKQQKLQKLIREAGDIGQDIGEIRQISPLCR